MSGPAPSRPHCEKPQACEAKGKGHCRRCHMRQAVKAKWQDPEFRAKQAAATKANWQDPEFRARNAAAVKAAVEIVWNADMDAALSHGLSRGHSMLAIAEGIGVCVPTARRRADMLRLDRPKRTRAA